MCAFSILTFMCGCGAAPVPSMRVTLLMTSGDACSAEAAKVPVTVHAHRQMAQIKYRICDAPTSLNG
jgi:hypothetical protein